MPKKESASLPDQARLCSLGASGGFRAGMGWKSPSGDGVPVGRGLLTFQGEIGLSGRRAELTEQALLGLLLFSGELEPEFEAVRAARPEELGREGEIHGADGTLVSGISLIG
jgi:hypothetical protein